MSEDLLIRNCSPTLAGLKTGNLFSCSFPSQLALLQYIRRLNRTLVPKGIRVVVMRAREGRALIYVFRYSAVQKMLRNRQAAQILRSRGYSQLRVEPCLCRLMGRCQEESEFPHEIGLFLGYPPEDVQGFIDNKACNQKCTGCWKVYGDADQARRTFEKYKRCTDIYCSQFEHGKSMDRLTVAG